MKISVVSPSNRQDGLKVVSQSLEDQTLQDFEWIQIGKVGWTLPGNAPTYVLEPTKKEGDLYNLNKAWNAGVRVAKGELIVFVVDYTEFAPDALEKFWDRYTKNPVTCFSGIGRQFKEGKQIWDDPRRIEGQKQHFCNPIDMEFRLASVPRAGIFAVGGLDEEYDKVAALSEKELCMRMAMLGYKFCIDQDIEYIFHDHGGHNAEWDKRYEEGKKKFQEDSEKIFTGKKVMLDYVVR